MSNDNEPDGTSDAAPGRSPTDGAKELVDVTIPVPAAHLASFFRAVASFLSEEHDDDGWRGGRMT